MLNELKTMNEKELYLWSATVKASELKAILKNEGIKGYSKYKKSELLEMVLDLVFETVNTNNNTIQLHTNVEKIYNDTLELNKEIVNRTFFEEDIENTFVGRYQAEEITLQELKDCIYVYNLNIPTLANDEDTKDMLTRRFDYYSQYEHYEVNCEIYYQIFNKEFEWDRAIVNDIDEDDWELVEFYENNHIDNNGLQLAYEYNEDNDKYLLIYKNYKLLGSSVDGKYSDIKKLAKYDNTITNEDLVTYKEMFKTLDKQLKEHEKKVKAYNEQIARENRIKQANKERYEKALHDWRTLYQPYSMGKYKFEDIWNEEGHIKDYALWREMHDFVKEEMNRKHREYRNTYDSLFGNKMTIKEEDKDVYKRIYRIASLKLHPDVAKDNGRAMTVLNQLKESWGI